jgi:hypothetical protein
MCDILAIQDYLSGRPLDPSGAKLELSGSVRPPADGVVLISGAQVGYMLEGIDSRNPLRTWRPEMAG